MKSTFSPGFIFDADFTLAKWGDFVVRDQAYYYAALEGKWAPMTIYDYCEGRIRGVLNPGDWRMLEECVEHDYWPPARPRVPNEVWKNFVDQAYCYGVNIHFENPFLLVADRRDIERAAYYAATFGHPWARETEYVWSGSVVNEPVLQYVDMTAGEYNKGPQHDYWPQAPDMRD